MWRMFGSARRHSSPPPLAPARPHCVTYWVHCLAQCPNVSGALGPRSRPTHVSPSASEIVAEAWCAMLDLYFLPSLYAPLAIEDKPQQTPTDLAAEDSELIL